MLEHMQTGISRIRISNLKSAVLSRVPDHALDEIIRRKPIWDINFTLHLWNGDSGFNFKS
jgi:hypothetical protein